MLTHLAEETGVAMYLLFSDLGIVRFKNDRFSLVIEIDSRDSENLGSGAYTPSDNLYFLPSGDFLVGSPKGLLLIHRTKNRWSSRWLSIPS